MNNRISFTQASMYHLATLNTLLRRINGRIYRLTDPVGIQALLLDARKSDNPKVKSAMSSLRAKLWEEEAEKFDRLVG